MMQQSSAKRASIIAMTAALYAVFFYVSSIVSLSGFTLLYLPVILLGVFPIWFGWNGLLGSMIGAFIGGALVEGFGLLGIFEVITAIIIFVPNWVFLPKNSFKHGVQNLLTTIVVYAITLFIGTAYILWQYTYLFSIGVLAFSIIGTFSFGVVLAATFGLNFAIQLAVCPALLRTVTPRLKGWGVYSGNFAEWRSHRKKTI
jgi:hypothetical protein